MDKVDAKTRETAVTLLDVLWTSKSAAGAAKTPTTTSPANAVNSSASITGFPRQVATNTGVIETAPTKTTLRHGFDTKGWGNDTTVQHQIKSHDPVSANKTANVFAKQLETASKLHQPEHDAQKMSQQRQQQQPQKLFQSSSTVPDSSYAPIAPATIVRNREHQLQLKNQEARFEHQEQELQNQMPSKKFHQNTFLANSSMISSNTSLNTTTSMTISMTSVGFGIDNNNTSWVDATEATIKAVQDAMERSSLRFHSLHSHSLQIKIKLGVPCVRTLASPPGDSESKWKQSHKQMETMNVDLTRLSSILPRVIPILPVQIEPGGLFVPGATPGAPSICTVVACITLESQPQSLPSKPQSQPQTLPQESVAPPLPPHPSLALEGSTTTGFPHPKQALELASNSTVATPLSSREYNIVGGTVTASNDQQLPQHQNYDWNKKRKLQVDGDDDKGVTKSIEILAMISEREINRRNILATKGAALATPTPQVLSSIAPINRDSNTSVGTGMLEIDSSATYHNGRTSSDQFVAPGVDQKLGSQITPTICKAGTPIIKPASARLPQNSSGKQSAKLVRSRVGGRNVSYSDYSNELPLPEERDCWAMSTRTTSTPVFPLKLHETLTQIEKDGLDDIIGWLPHGRSFKIHKQKEFTEIILPRYFVMTKKSSFLRQLNLYSFNRFSAGTTDKGSYYHEKFLRGRKFLSRRMTRQKVNGNRIRSAGNPDEEPDLSLYPICRDDERNSNHHLALSSSASASSSSSCLLATSGATGRAIVSTGDISLSSSTPSALAPMMHAAPSSSDPSVGGPISGRNPPVGASPFLRVL